MIHMGTSDVSKPHKQRLLEATDPTPASSSDEVLTLQHPFAHLESAVHEVIPSHILLIFLLIFSKDYFQLNLREEYSKIECITVRNMSKIQQKNPEMTLKKENGFYGNHYTVTFGQLLNWCKNLLIC